VPSAHASSLISLFVTFAPILCQASDGLRWAETMHPFLAVEVGRAYFDLQFHDAVMRHITFASLAESWHCISFVRRAGALARALDQQKGGPSVDGAASSKWGCLALLQRQMSPDAKLQLLNAEVFSLAELDAYGRRNSNQNALLSCPELATLYREAYYCCPFSSSSR
jgi:hypothetical protein